ncbi:MAG: DUF1292 domain-containing protein [Bacillota bacterium]
MAEEEGLIKVVNEEEGIVILEEHDGNEAIYQIVTVVDVDDVSYLILLPEENHEDGEGYALKITEDQNGERVYEPVIDNNELSMVQQELEEQYE